MKEQIFQIIDEYVEDKFGPDMHRPRDFEELMSCEDVEKVFDIIEQAYRDERLDEKLHCLIADAESEHSRILTEQSLMAGRV